MRRHLRHIHIPDHPPRYVPRHLPGALRDYLEVQILEQRAQPRSSFPNSRHAAAAGIAVRSWLQSASPPPIVLSFTGRPTFVIPKSASQRLNVEQEVIRQKLSLPQHDSFPVPVGATVERWGPFGSKKESILHGLRHSSKPGVMFVPCAEPFYFGPGVLSIRPVIDLSDQFQRGKHFSTKFAYERILEDTTVNVLKREYGIEAFVLAGNPGVWVQSAIPSEGAPAVYTPGKDAPYLKPGVRRIATVHADIVNNITRWGVAINVGHPASPTEAFGTEYSPWQRLGQDTITTSVAAELTHRDGPLPKPVSLRQIEYLTTTGVGPQDTGKLLRVPYSMFQTQEGDKQAAALGMYNRDLATAWTFEFARQLEMRGDFVDCYKHGEAHIDRSVLLENAASELRGPVYDVRPVGDGTVASFPHQPVDLSEDAPEKEDWDLPWTRYWANLGRFLDESIKARDKDTRMSALDIDNAISSINKQVAMPKPLRPVQAHDPDNAGSAAFLDTPKEILELLAQDVEPPSATSPPVDESYKTLVAVDPGVVMPMPTHREMQEGNGTIRHKRVFTPTNAERKQRKKAERDFRRQQKALAGSDSKPTLGTRTATVEIRGPSNVQDGGG